MQIYVGPYPVHPQKVVGPPGSLFREHWRRFIALPPRNDSAVQLASERLYREDQMDWALGIIPWHTWRFPFQREMLLRLEKHCDQEDATQLYSLINRALATARGNFITLPSEDDANALMETLNQCCSPSVAQEYIGLILQIIMNKPRKSIHKIERFLFVLSKNMKSKRMISLLNYNSFLFLSKVLNSFLCNLMSLKHNAQTKVTVDKIVQLSFDAIDFILFPRPSIVLGQQTMIESGTITPAVYEFWNWQYTYRNVKYQDLRRPLEETFHNPDALHYKPPVTNHNEFEAVYGRQGSIPGPFDLLHPEAEDAVHKSVEIFNYYPAWPILDYTSDFILHRMLTGQFTYLERKSPAAKVSRKNEFNFCLRNPALCENEHGIIKHIKGRGRDITVCDPECIQKINNLEYDAYTKVINQEHPRIRKEGIHRMIGLWLWDYCQEHQVKPAEAMRALRERHFPADNPTWDYQVIPELANNPKNNDWYTYRVRTTDTPTLYADYQDACACVEAAKILPRKRGTQIQKTSLSLDNTHSRR